MVPDFINRSALSFSFLLATTPTTQLGAPVEAEPCELGTQGERCGSGDTLGQKSGYLLKVQFCLLLNGCQGFLYLSIFRSRNGNIEISPTNLTEVVV